MKGGIQNDESNMHKLPIYYLTYEYIVLLHQMKHFHLITDYNNVCDVSIYLLTLK